MTLAWDHPRFSVQIVPFRQAATILKLNALKFFKKFEWRSELYLKSTSNSPVTAKKAGGEGKYIVSKIVKASGSKMKIIEDSVPKTKQLKAFSSSWDFFKVEMQVITLCFFYRQS